MADDGNEVTELEETEEQPSVFIEDEGPDMTVREKNEQLSAELAAGDTADLNIYLIERDESEIPGWNIHYQEEE